MSDERYSKDELRELVRAYRELMAGQNEFVISINGVPYHPGEAIWSKLWDLICDDLESEMAQAFSATFND